MKPKLGVVNAIFQGQDGSCGYKHGAQYTLNITMMKGRMVVAYVKGDNVAPEEVQYDSIFGLITNWTNITTVSVSEYERGLTFGEKAAGISFNPGGHEEVNILKRKSADLIDLCNDARAAAGRGEKGRYYSTAITYQEIAQMEAVKAATLQYDTPQ
jgi:hypothetical protein